MHDSSDLAAIERWVLTVITHPDGVSAGVAAAHSRVPFTSRAAGDVVVASGRLSPEERLGIYHHDYYRRLLECMQAMYPALRHALGRDLFDQFTLDYLSSYPSTSPSLFDLSNNFARHLADTRPQGEEWPDFIIDLARLERAFFVVYDGPGTEGKRVLGREDVTDELRDWWLAARFTPSPALRLFAFRYPVVPYFQDVRGGSHPDLPPPHRSWAALSRRDYTVHVTELTQQQHRLLTALVSGTPVASSLAEAGVIASAMAWSWVSRWAELGFFTSVDAHDGRSAPPGVDRAMSEPASRGDPT